MGNSYLLVTAVLSVAFQCLFAQEPLIALGNFGNKQWFAGPDWVNQSTARASCASAGLRLGKIDSLEELTWLSTVTESVISRFPHTDAVFQNEAQSYVWGHSGEGLNPLLRFLKTTMPPNHNYGLFAMFGQSKLMSESTNMPQSYVCYNQTNAASDLVLEQKHHSNPFPSEKVKKESENRYKKTQRAGQNVTFIGSYEGTSYFFDPSMTPTVYNTAVNFCNDLGMELPSFKSNEEMEWLLNVTDSLMVFIWTDGFARDIVTSYRWQTDNSRLDLSLGELHRYNIMRLILNRNPPALLPVYGNVAYTVCSFKACS